MPSDWIPNCGSQLERAIRALFIEKGAASPDDCFVSNDSRTRGDDVATDIDNGITSILAQQSTHEPETTGNEVWTVMIQNKFGAALQPEGTDTNLQRLKLDQRVGRQMLALMQGGTESSGLRFTCTDITTYGRALADQDTVNDADMTEFTCLYGRFIGSTRGRPEDASCAWVEVRNFEFWCCPTNVD